jgi:hypothetical protein
MKKINLTKTKKELKKLNADESSTDLILNNVYMYNDLVVKYNNGTIGRDIYLLAQLNSQVVKQLAEIKKQNKKSSDDEDSFIDLIESMKKNN